MAMLTISKEASVKRATHVKTYPSTTSITPLIKGTPGTRYRTLVASAISEVVSKNQGGRSTERRDEGRNNEYNIMIHFLLLHLLFQAIIL